jgi:hypothetical protein
VGSRQYNILLPIQCGQTLVNTSTRSFINIEELN